MKIKQSLFLLLLLLGSVAIQCSRGRADGTLSPKASLKAMEVAEGFHVDLVAAEPLVVAPVAMTFDGQGRMWVVEMMGYMPDTLGTGEELPVGKIVILEDKTGNGKADKRTIFLDSLVMPRAICLIGGGILVAEPPNLWFYEIKDGKPAGRTLVDSAYAEGGNVEHQPNGLLRALDNWVYSAKYDKRYRRMPDGRWKKEETHFRGQWGISQDDRGRLYYNDNSNNLWGDFFPPGLGTGNPNQRHVSGYRETIVSDKRVYPIRPTTGVNRGYMDGILDSSGRLLNFTAACGPLVYRGGLIDGFNAFVAEPAANLIKRNVLDTSGYRVTGRQAYVGHEFLASIDERFRPVNLHDGPDGGLYVVDMYRGIIQHSTYLTPYLKSEIAKRELNQPLGMGRIYRILPKGAKRRPVTMPRTTDSLIALLDHPNGWVRDQAQQTLVDNGAVDAVHGLRKLLTMATDPIPCIHALWTLEGLGLLTVDDVAALVGHPSGEVRAQAISALPTLTGAVSAEELTAFVRRVIQQADTLIMPHAVLALTSVADVADPATERMIQQLAVDHGKNPYIADALISGLGGREERFLRWADDHNADRSTLFYRRLARIAEARQGKADAARQAALTKQYPQGVALFTTACQPCHGENGEGVASVAPPLAGSEWVKGNKDRLIALVLYGLTGPVEVAGRIYDAPDISGEMPGIVHNAAIDDAELAELLSYIRNAWGNNTGDELLPEELGEIRSKFGDRAKPFTQQELYVLFGKD